MTEALKELEARLVAASGPDREIDALLAVALLKPEQATDDLIYYRRVDRDDNCTPGTYWRKSRSGMSLQTAETYTASLDAAIALCERVLPGHSMGFRTCSNWAEHHKWAGKPAWEAVVTDTGDTDDYYPFEHDYHSSDDVSEFFGEHCSPALALCLAIVRALSKVKDGR